MYGKDFGGWIGTTGFFLRGSLEHISLNVSIDTFWLFQCAFVIAVISIVSGAVAERVNFSAYLLYALVMTGIIYPIAGHWIWGGGWLARLGMIDFAGSAVIHGLGGFAALAAAIFIGPRIGKFTSDGPTFLLHLSVPSYYGLDGSASTPVVRLAQRTARSDTLR
jgi:Amt family ammonium transporter